MKRVLCIICTLFTLILMITGCQYQRNLNTSDTSETTNTYINESNSNDSSNTIHDEPQSTLGNSNNTSNSTENNQTNSTKGGADTQSQTNSPTKQTTTKLPKDSTPSTENEFRGVWISYMELSHQLKGKNPAQAQQAIDTIMKNIKSYKLNTVVLHVRANSDAYYKSSVFCAASNVESLINVGFDPLEYAVQAAHKRGLKLHAWVNPYRVGTKPSYAKSSDIFEVNGYYYYNPASHDVQTLILRGIAEIVNNYDVDGIQFDDYFYPYDTNIIPPSVPAEFEKNDYTAYQKQGGTLNIADWRRSQVSSLIASAYFKVHSRNNCVFGISPRAKMSDNYYHLYADIQKWIANKGFIDYICPQIYFGFENSDLPFDRTVASWAAMKRHQSVKLYIGLGLYKTGVSPDAYAGSGKQEWVNHDDIMKRSVQLLRTQKACSGMIFYSYRSFYPKTRCVNDNQSYSVDIGMSEVENLRSIL